MQKEKPITLDATSGKPDRAHRRWKQRKKKQAEKREAREKGILEQGLRRLKQQQMDAQHLLMINALGFRNLRREEPE